MTETLVEPQAETKIEIRSGDGYQVAEVNFPKRIVTCVAMPYERPTTIYEPAGSYQEVVSRSAFDGIERRPKSVRANRGHVADNLVGKVEALHPSRKEGLVAEVKMFTTDIGERTLIECDQGGLDVSAGFGLLRRDGGRGPAYEDAETWERSDGGLLRRLNRLFFHHLAFVPDPAYPDAVVLDVRDTAVRPQESPARDETPNRDLLTADELRAASDALNRRWDRSVAVDVRILPGE